MLLAARDSVLIPSPSSTPEFRRGPQRLSACFVWRGQGEWKTENTKQKTENRSLALPIFHFRFSVRMVRTAHPTGRVCEGIV
jgi:hypothetical protein